MDKQLNIAHKKEKGLIRINIRNEKEAGAAFEEVMTDMDETKKAVWYKRCSMTRGGMV